MSEAFDRVEKELVPGALRGYRRWRFDFTGQLAAVNFYYSWTPGRNEATHVGVKPKHEAPMKRCSCGLYAHHDPRGSFNYMDCSYKDVIVVGSIKAYGKIILGDLGFKAQYAEIESLVVPGPMTAAFQHRYPQVKIFDRFTDLVKEFPPIPVDELLGPKPEPEWRPLMPPITLHRSGVLTPEQIEEFKKLLLTPIPKPDIEKESTSE